ncbi:MAG: hypothetical protein ACLUTU_03505 [Blautia faecis]
MSDLRPTGAPVVIGGQEYNILFTIGAIEAIQETCNKALVETMPAIARVADFKTDSEDVKTFYSVVAAFLTVDTGKEVKAEDIDGIIKPAEMKKTSNYSAGGIWIFPCRILTVTVKILKTKRKKTQTRRPGYKRSPVTVCGM